MHAMNEGLVGERVARLQRSEDLHPVLLEVNNVLLLHRERDGLFAAIAEALRGLLAFDRCSVALHDPAADTFTTWALAGTVSARPITLQRSMGSPMSR